MTTKDWTGNSKSIYSCHGASNHSDTEREVNDYYATPPSAVEMLLKIEDFSEIIIEPACGQGHIAEVLKENGHRVLATDLIDRGYGIGGVDFFEMHLPMDADIITNPPYSLAKEFVEHAMDLVTDGHKVAMFLKLTFLEGRGISSCIVLSLAVKIGDMLRKANGTRRCGTILLILRQ